MNKSVFSSLVAVLASLVVATPAIAAEEVNLYSYRQQSLLQPLTDAFTAETGIKVNVVHAEKGLAEKIKAAGANNPADLVLTVDIGRLEEVRAAGLFEAVDSPVLNDVVPAHLRHPENLWFALTTRARVVYAHKDRVKEGELASLNDLADPKWKGRICTRSGKHVYNIGLIASVIAEDGEEAAETWLRGVKDNLARKPQGNDRAQAKAIFEGQCDLAIANRYYMGKMFYNTKSPEQQQWAEQIRVEYLDQQVGGRGQHINISGAGLLNTAKNKGNAIKLLEFLVGETAQGLYATANFEEPVRAGIKTDEFIESLGDFKSDRISLQDVADQRAAAARLVDRVGFDM
ncbi:MULTISPECIES: extracellular solute-binding protein [unclassified Agarivorans]|uniref:extracellular solute-binding protein n=1 Tax=unclassified Agarivorans TaxID=2636026 RepID=UPI0026E2605F|nr:MULTISPECIES: extracellular solute-binding protein [unclassified Agarivorans]MDO6686941.1 extracellular solute-binding protein [Agarivorans sp. 3_MG-2023]MDO6716738.1 extracellular solute-binding protein [Agarivorans sp. 2_MG-2023]